MVAMLRVASQGVMTGYEMNYNAMFNRTLVFYAVDVGKHEGLDVL